MEADYPQRFRPAPEAQRAGQWRCRTCELDVDGDYPADGRCPGCAGPLRPQFSEPEGAELHARGALPADILGQLARAGFHVPQEPEHLAHLQRILAAVADQQPGDVPEEGPSLTGLTQAEVDALPRVVARPYVSVRGRARPVGAPAAEDGEDGDVLFAAQATAGGIGSGLAALPRGARGRAAVCRPADASRADNAGALAGAVAIADRGGVSFARKVLTAEAAGAAALLVVQRPGAPWPFTMGDTAGEAAASRLPSAMLAPGDGARLRALVEALAASDPPRELALCLDPNTADALCAVCLDDLLVEAEAVELPCSHRFHEGCIAGWLLRRGRCPVCRAAVREGAPTGEEAPRGVAVDEEAAVPESMYT